MKTKSGAGDGSFLKLAKENGGMSKSGRLSKQFILDASSGKYGETAKKQADHGIKLSGKTDKVEQQNATTREKDKTDRERKKANTILSRAQRARGGGSYNANRSVSKLG